MIRVDSTGVSASSLEEALAETEEQLRAIFGEDLALEAQTPQGQLAGLIAIIKAEVGEAVVATGNGTSVDHADGVQQDAIGSVLDVRRRAAARSTVTATLTGVDGTNVPAGSRARTTAGDEFRTREGVTLTPTGVDTLMESVAEGAVEADPGTLTRIVTVVSGWETVTNARAARPGRARESNPDYRAAYRTRTAHSSRGPLASIEGALESAGAGRQKVVENDDDVAITEQLWPIKPHGLLVVAESGTDANIRRAVENHRGMGVPALTAIVGGTPNNGTLDGVNNGTVSFGGRDYRGLNLSAAGSPAAKAAQLTLLLAPAGVVVVNIDGLYIAIYTWQPDVDIEFGGGAVETAFGLAPAAATPSPGPFVRTRTRDLTINLTVTRTPRFPSDGLQQIRAVVNAVVEGYGVGQQVWVNDFLRVVEGIEGTRVTATSVQYAGADVSGVDVPLDVVWALPSANLVIAFS